uniref:Uncharacterized protein n=1 Tax=Arundo donax TaxID=35708 RepID=A0A0A8YP77_ARUDO
MLEVPLFTINTFSKLFRESFKYIALGVFHNLIHILMNLSWLIVTQYATWCYIIFH